MLVDARHGLKATDTAVLDTLDQAAVSYQIVLTKGDALKTAEIDRRIAASFPAYTNRLRVQDMARLLADGARFVNLPRPLTRFRTTGMLDRRRSDGIVAAEKRMQATLVELGLVSRPRAAFNFAARSAFRLLPTGLLHRTYRALFHRRASRR